MQWFCLILLGVVNAADHGLKSEPGFDNSSALVAAAAARRTPGETIQLPAGEFDFNWRHDQPKLRDVHLVGDGTTLRLVPAANHRAKILDLRGDCLVERIHFDGRWQEQDHPPDGEWAQGGNQWQAGIYHEDGHLVVTDVSGQDSGNLVFSGGGGSDSVTVTRLRSRGMLRGGVVVTGDRPTRVVVSDSNVETLDFEPNRAFDYDVTVRDTRTGDLQVLFRTAGCRGSLTNVTTDTATIHSAGRVRIGNSQLGHLNLRRAGDFALVDSTAQSVAIAWDSKEVALIDGCRIESDAKVGIYTASDHLAANNRLIVRRTTIRGQDTAIEMRSGGRWLIEGNLIDCRRAFVLAWADGGRFYDVTLSANRFSEAVRTYWYSPLDHPANVVTHVLQAIEGWSNFETRRGMHHKGSNRYRGARVIYSDRAPVDAEGKPVITEALPGDLWHDETSGRTWVCRNGGYDPAKESIAIAWVEIDGPR